MIRLTNVYKIYNQSLQNEFVALKNINLNIKDKECVVLKGVSGSGKSTLLSIIGGMNKPTSGEALIENKAIAKLPDLHLSNFRAKSIGFVFQSFHLIENLSVYDNVTIPLIPHQKDTEQITQMVNNALQIIKIDHKKNDLAKNLSGGEKQRVAIARALVNNPNIILLDEPTANLDIENSQNLITILQDLKKLGKTVVIATHDMIFDDLDFVDKIVHIQNGEIVE
ncbi:MAG: ABC transporter ATP-binding protein [Campylobacterales bacterium]|nr:ABC transporter ATP-binding protein [Campylobacterales bacterium]